MNQGVTELVSSHPSVAKRWLRLGRLALVGGSALLLSLGWHWHRFDRRLTPAVGVLAVVAAYLLVVSFNAARTLAGRLLQRRVGAAFRRRVFAGWADAFFVFGCSVGLAYFLRNHVLRRGYLVAWLLGSLLVVYLALRSACAPTPRRRWLVISAEMLLSLLAVQVVIQYVIYSYAIVALTVEPWRTTVLPRAILLSGFWFAALALATAAGRVFPAPWRRLLLALWWLSYTGGLFLGFVNIAIAYHSGFYFSPIVTEHIRGASEVILHPFGLGLLGLFTALAAATLALLRRYSRVSVELRFSSLVGSIVFGLGLLAGGGVHGAWRAVPEYVSLQSFYEAVAAQPADVRLSPLTVAKLERFGLRYRLDEFFVAPRHPVFATPVGAAAFLPRRVNVVIVFWESLSSRLSEIYSPKLTDVTPALQRFVADPRTTLFRRYYNASTPTVTSILAALCSFLPPFGHPEVRQLSDLSRLRLSCLPAILGEHGWPERWYITAVDKDFANKDSMLESMGVRSLGRAELKRRITGRPLSWGYSDHQMFPVLAEMAQTSAEPFLLMISTIDSHTPYDLSEDLVPHGDGSNPLLNAIHSTDDAFGRWWDRFRASPVADRTLVVVVGDHPAFPSTLLQDTIQPDDGKIIGPYDETFFALYLPDSSLPRVVDTYASSIDLTPTILHLLGVNAPNVFEGHSIFGRRPEYPNLLGMDTMGLWSNQLDARGERRLRHDLRHVLRCGPDAAAASVLTPCDLKEFFQWKRAMYTQGRLFAP